MSVSPERTAVRKQIRTIMASRDLSANDLAKKTGLCHAYVRGLISGAFTHKQGRKKLEAALNSPIWTPAAEFYAAKSHDKEEGSTESIARNGSGQEKMGKPKRTQT